MAPALFVYQGKDRYPVEAYPRMGPKGIIGVEEALQQIAPVPAVVEEAEEEAPA